MLGTELRPVSGNRLANKAKKEPRRCGVSSSSLAFAVSLCFFVSASLLLPRLVRLCLAHFFLFVAIALPSSPQAALPRRPPLHRFLFRDPGALFPRSLSLGFFRSLLFLSCPLCLLLEKKPKKKPKGQVGIKVDTRLNKEQPTKLQIYAPSAVCNCTQPEVCPLFAFFFFLRTVHRRCLFRTQPSPGRYFQTPPVRSRCSNKRFPWAIY